MREYAGGSSRDFFHGHSAPRALTQFLNLTSCGSGSRDLGAIPPSDVGLALPSTAPIGQRPKLSAKIVGQKSPPRGVQIPPLPHFLDPFFPFFSSSLCLLA